MSSANASIHATSLLTPKTRVLTDKELSKRLNAGCPHCGAPLIEKPRFKTNKRTGRKEYGGSFMGCSAYRTCGVDYSVSVETGRESIV